MSCPKLRLGGVWSKIKAFPIFAGFIGNLLLASSKIIIGLLGGGVVLIHTLFLNFFSYSTSSVASGSKLIQQKIKRTHNWYKSRPLPSEVGLEDRVARLRVLGLGFVLLALVVVVKLLDLQGMDRRKWETIASKQHKTALTIQGARGTIYDASGRVLAASVEEVALEVYPKHVTDIKKTAAFLTKVTGEDSAEFERKIRLGKFFYAAKRLPREVASELELAKLAGVTAVTEFRRDYPQGDIGKNIVGRVSVKGDGQSGIELAFNNLLSAESQVIKVRRDAKGRRISVPPEGGLLPIKIASNEEVTLAMNWQSDAAALRDEGVSVTLTVDTVLQNILEEEFLRAREETQAAKVFGVMMDAESGEILALAQSKSGKSEENVLEAMKNVVVQDNFEPGSIFKPIVAAIALEDKLVGRNEPINCENGKYSFAGHLIGDSHPIPTVPFSEVLVRSSNIGMTKIATRVGSARLQERIRQFGFGASTGIELPGEGKGIVKNPKSFAKIDLATTSYGQGISVTALQMARAYAAIANGGFLVQPRITRNKEIGEARRVLSSETAKTMCEILVGVVDGEHGTGKQARILGIDVSGKTGTAQKVKASGRGYDQDSVMASFIGFVDGKAVGVDRKIVMITVVDTPGVMPRWGGTVAAPVFRKSMERALTYLMAHDRKALRS